MQFDLGNEGVASVGRAEIGKQSQEGERGKAGRRQKAEGGKGKGGRGKAGRRQRAEGGRQEWVGCDVGLTLALSLE